MQNILIMFKNFKKYLKKIHYSLPPSVRIFYYPFFSLKIKLELIFLSVFIYTGKELHTSEEIKIAYLGRDKRIANYWSERLLEKSQPEIKKDRIKLWNVSKYIESYLNNCDLVIVELNKITRKFISINKGFLLPRWIEMQLDINKGIKNNQRRDITRLIRKYSLSYEKRESEKDFKFFHEHMFIPFIDKRHGGSAIQCDYDYILDKFRKKNSELGFIMKDQQPVAGSFIECVRKKTRLTGLGILNGRKDILKMGVVGAVYHYTVEHCKNKGIDSILVGGTSPALSDGLTKYKLSLGTEPADLKYFGNTYLWFIPLQNSEAVKSIFEANPIINRIKNQFYRSIFVNPSKMKEKSELLKLLSRTHCNNIKGTNIYCFNNIEIIRQWIKEEIFDNFNVLEFNI